MIASLFLLDGGAGRPYPAEGEDELVLPAATRKRSAALMRVNHAGEVSAQALYRAQAVIARDVGVREVMRQAAGEEIDHLHWCRRRLQELGAGSSWFDPFWFCGSFVIGLVAGSLGDRWNLGFLAETELQVVEHLDGHLRRLPVADRRSRAVVTQMREDEAGHATTALHAGARELPEPVRVVMRCGSRVMTGIAYYL